MPNNRMTTVEATLSVGDLPTPSKRETPALPAPALNVKDAWDDGIAVHLVRDVEAHLAGIW